MHAASLVVLHLSDVKRAGVWRTRGPGDRRRKAMRQCAPWLVMHCKTNLSAEKADWTAAGDAGCGTQCDMHEIYCSRTVTLQHKTSKLLQAPALNRTLACAPWPMSDSLRGFILRGEALKLYRSFLRAAQQAPPSAQGDFTSDACLNCEQLHLHAYAASWLFSAHHYCGRHASGNVMHSCMRLCTRR